MTRRFISRPPPPPGRTPWETGSQRSSSLSIGEVGSENFTTMSREFNALVLAGSEHGATTGEGGAGGGITSRITTRCWAINYGRNGLG
ncbi:unnamed protein product [Linum trigynum]|uniref:Uncharacterized protein n=1 Tax=Linum trigynum TaxID=586398 RepID=A0AAV2DPY2_9ROSI